MRSRGDGRPQAAGLKFAAFLALSAVALPAYGQDEAGRTPQFSANIGWASDYRFRGFTQTREKPAVQGGVDVTVGWFYAGVWASNVDFGRWDDTLKPADFEIELYGGIKRKLGPAELNLGAIYYAYAGGDGLPGVVATRDPDFFEITAGISGPIHAGLTGEFNVYYSPDYFGETGRNWVFEGTLKRALAKFGTIDPSISGTLGYSLGDEDKGGIDYFFWNAGFSFIFLDYFEFDLRYFDTFDVPSGIECADRCDGRVVARITFEY
jgi:uncharacterized protein (TIGR02001 family)